MLYINKITNDPIQNINLIGIPGINIPAQLRYLVRIQRWVIDFSYNGKEYNGIAISTAPNMLRQYRNEIPFGLCCICVNGLDPYGQNDFANQSANLYLLDSSDVAQVETDYFTP